MTAPLPDRALRDVDAWEREALGGMDALARKHAGAAAPAPSAVLPDERQTPPAGPLPTRRIGDVPEPGPVEWLVRGLWTRGAFGFVGAEPKSWKSWLTLQMAVCVATGSALFGRDVERGRVLIFSAEGGANGVRRRIGALCRALDFAPADLDVDVIDVPILRLDDPAVARQLLATVAALRPVLVILDPLRELHTSDENESATIAMLLAPLRTLQARFGCACILVHHMRKASDAPRSGSVRGGQRLRGSSALHGASDSALYLDTKGEGEAKRVTVTAEHRDAMEPDPFVLRLRTHDAPEGLSAWLEIVADETAEQEAEREAERSLEVAERTRDRVLRVIRIAEARRKPLKSMRAVRAAIKGRAAVADAALGALVEEHAIVRDASGAFRIAPDADAGAGAGADADA